MYEDTKKSKAIELRKAGWTMPKISKELGIAKSTVWGWVHHIELSPEIKANIRAQRRGEKHSEDTKKRMSEKQTARWAKFSLVDSNGNITCTLCGKPQPAENFYKRIKRKERRYSSYCKECHKKWYRDDWLRLRQEAFEKLGGAVCVECGCDVFEILEINHINGDGKEERKKYTSRNFLRDIIADRVDVSRYNVLCRVCNTQHYVEHMRGIKGHIVIWSPEQA